MALIEEVQILIPALLKVPVAMMVTSNEGEIAWTNSKFCDMIGYPPSAVAGKSVAVLEPDGVAYQHIQTCLHEGRGELVWRRKSGELVAVSATVAALNGSMFHLWVVTPQSRPERALLDLIAGYSTVFSTMADGVVFQDASGRIGLCNESAERILGLSASQMSGRSSADPRWAAVYEDGSPFPGDSHPSMVTLHTGKPLTNVVMGVHKPDGSLTWISINSRPVWDGLDRPHSVVTTFSDITEQRRMQVLVGRAEEQLAKGFMASPAMMTLSVVDAAGTSTYINVNEAFERFTGYRREELIGKTDDEIGFWVDPAERAHAVREFQNRGRIDQFEHRFRRKDGAIRIALTSTDTVELFGRMVAVATALDITERRLSGDRGPEVELSLFANVAEAVFIFEPGEDDGSSRLVAVNRSACELLGYAEAELLTMTWQELVSEQSVSILNTLFLQGRVNRDQWLRRKDGRLIVVRMNTQLAVVRGALRVISTAY